MKKIIVLFIIMLFLLTTCNVAGLNKYVVEFKKNYPFEFIHYDELDQYQDNLGSYLYYVCDGYWLSQSFVPSKQVLTRVKLWLYHWNKDVSYEIKVAIRNVIDGDDLTSKTLIPLIPNQDCSGDWIEFDFTDIATNVGETYYIVCKAFDGFGDRDGSLALRVCLDGNSYPKGHLYRSSDRGRNWQIAIPSKTGEKCDGCFATYGYDDPNAKPDLECEGSLNWQDVKIGETITGEFSIENIGFNGSLLDWGIKSYPDWGEWTFNSIEGVGLTPEDGKLKVKVTVIAPEDKNMNFTGEILVENMDNDSDNEVIQVSLSTSKTKSINVFNPWIFRLIQRFPILEFLL